MFSYFKSLVFGSSTSEKTELIRDVEKHKNYSIIKYKPKKKVCFAQDIIKKLEKQSLTRSK